jgi:nucleotide-binding universal stress UspA family protein
VVFRRILTTTDGSDASIRGIRAALEIVGSYQAEFIVLTIVQVPHSLAIASHMDQHVINEYVERTAQEGLRPALSVVRDSGLGAEVKVVVGSPPELILDEAIACHADLVVMGRRNWADAKELVLGSVSQRVARSITVPLLLVP